MRLVTWNACKGRFERKAALLEPLQADVAVIPEIAAPPVSSPQCLWFGDNQNQGIAVVARGPYTLQPLPEKPDAPRYVIPILVEGPVSFVLFAVWTLGAQPMRYVRAASTAIDLYADLFNGSPVVLLGDFNSNAIWDKDHPKELNHSAMVRRLDRNGIVSAYHHTRGISHGREVEPTFYLHWHESKPFHIDYCFLPQLWANQIERVEIGTFEEWKESSDHRPLLVELRNIVA